MLNDYDEIKDGDQESINRFENILRSGDNCYFDTDIFDYLIEYYIEQMLFEKALFTCEKAIEQHPHSTCYLIHKARVLSAKGENAEAVKVIKAAEQLQPNDPEITVAKAYICVELGKYREAIEFFEAALLFWDEKHEINYQIAVSYLQLEDYTQARKYFLRSLRLKPDAPDVLNDLMFCLTKQNKNEEIISIYRQYTEQYPQNSHYWTALGKAFMQNEQFEDAFLAFDAAEAIEGEIFEVSFCKGKIYASRKEFHKALDFYRQLLPLPAWNDFDELFYEAGICADAIGASQEAAKYLKKVCEINSLHFDATLALAGHYEKNAKYSEALKYYVKATKIRPDKWAIWLACARMSILSEEIENAEDYFEKALAHSDAAAEAYISFIVFLIQSGENAKAVSVAEEGAERFPDNTELPYCLAAALMNEKKVKEALHYLQQAVCFDYASHAIIFEIFEKKDVQIALFKIIQEFHNSNK